MLLATTFTAPTAGTVATKRGTQNEKRASRSHLQCDQGDEDGRENGKNGRNDSHSNSGFQRASLPGKPATPSTIMATIHPICAESPHQNFTDGATVRPVETAPASGTEDARQVSPSTLKIGAEGNFEIRISKFEFVVK